MPVVDHDHRMGRVKATSAFYREIVPLLYFKKSCCSSKMEVVRSV